MGNTEQTDPLTPASGLIAALQSRGHTLRVSRGKLLVGSAANLTADDLRAIGREREAMLHLLIDDAEWERRRAALDPLPPVRWPGDDVAISSGGGSPADSLPAAEGVVILTDGHGWDVAFVAADLASIIRTYSAMRKSRADTAGGCPRCGSTAVAAGDGTANHHGRLTCGGCGRHLRWLSAAEAKRHGVRRVQSDGLFAGQ